MCWNQKQLHIHFKEYCDDVWECLRINNGLMDGLTASKVVKQEVDGEGEDVDTQPLGYQGKGLV